MLIRKLLLWCIALPVLPAFALEQVVIEAGRHDRQSTIVTFTVPEKSGHFVLISGEDSIVVQVEGTHAYCILGAMKAGTSKTYKVANAKQEWISAIALKQAGTQLNFANGEHPVLQYNGDKTPLPATVEPEYQRGGYIHPVYTPSGKLLTDDYPLNHKHHHGIWSPWTKTEYEGRKPDFWNMGQKTGRVDFDKLGESFAGPIASGFTTHHKMIDMKAVPEKNALNERWDVSIYRPMTANKNPIFVFDMTITQNVVDSPLILPKYQYGGLGFRGRGNWNGKGDVVTMLTSEGLTRADGNGKPSRWCWIGGPAEDGKPIGMTIMDHPSNFRSPQPVRLNPDQPFFCYSPSAAGDWKIEKGTPYVATYRFIAADGAADVAEINRLWNDFAEPPKVTVK